VLGRVVIERKEHVDVLGDLGNRLGPFGAVVGGECFDRLEGVVAVLGVVDLRECGFRAWVRRLRQGGKNLRADVDPAPLLSDVGEHLPQGLQNPRAPSPTASTGAVIPRRRQERSRSAHDCDDSRNPSASATSSLVPSTCTPIVTSRHTLSCSKRTLRWIPSTHIYIHVVGVFQ
jgi:hypothetical protein